MKGTGIPFHGKLSDHQSVVADRQVMILVCGDGPRVPSFSLPLTQDRSHTVELLDNIVVDVSEAPIYHLLPPLQNTIGIW